MGHPREELLPQESLSAQLPQLETKIQEAQEPAPPQAKKPLKLLLKPLPAWAIISYNPLKRPFIGLASWLLNPTPYGHSTVFFGVLVSAMSAMSAMSCLPDHQYTDFSGTGWRTWIETVSTYKEHQRQRTRAQVHIYVYIYMCIHTYTYIHIYIHTYTYIHIYIHTHTYIYIYI